MLQKPRLDATFVVKKQRFRSSYKMTSNPASLGLV